MRQKDTIINRKKHILIIEGEDNHIILIEFFLGSQYEITSTAYSDTALKYIECQNYFDFDLVVLDLLIPKTYNQQYFGQF